MRDEFLAIIRNAHVAAEDHSDELCVWFDAYTSECGAALQIVGPSDTERFATLWTVMKGDVNNLNGKPCWVTHPSLGITQFERMWRDV